MHHVAEATNNELVRIDYELPSWARKMLVAGGDDLVRAIIVDYLSERRFEYIATDSLSQAVDLLWQTRACILILHEGLADGNAFALLDHCPELTDHSIVGLLSPSSKANIAIEALRRREHDVITPPFTLCRFSQRLEIASGQWRSRKRSQHHKQGLERFDGTGYLHGLTGRRIPIAARFFSITDSMDAMFYERARRSAMHFDEMIDELRRGSGSKFDPDILEAFLTVPKSVRQRAEEV